MTTETTLEAPLARMLVATKTFSIRGRYGTENYIARQSRIRADHETVRGREHLFEDLTESDPFAGAYRSSVIRVSAEPIQLVERSTTPYGASDVGVSAAGVPGAVPQVTWRDEPEEVVLLHSGALARISAEVSDSRDGNETGGWLMVSTLDSDDTEIRVATGPGERARFEPNRVGLDLEHRVTVEETARRMDSRLIVAGDYHSHPGVREARPSEGDRTAWARNFEFLENDLGARAAWTGIIATSKCDDDWRYPELHGFVVRRDPITRRLICENARIKEID